MFDGYSSKPKGFVALMFVEHKLGKGAVLFSSPGTQMLEKSLYLPYISITGFYWAYFMMSFTYYLEDPREGQSAQNKAHLCVSWEICGGKIKCASLCASHATASLHFLCTCINFYFNFINKHPSSCTLSQIGSVNQSTKKVQH